MILICNEEAKRRLHEDFYFIGLTEEPMATANLFLTMHAEDGARRNIFSVDNLTDPPFVFSSQRQNKHHDTMNHQNLIKILNDFGWRDEKDEELYAEAARIFYWNCQLNGIKTKFKTTEELMAFEH